MQAVKHEALTQRRWPNVGLLLAHRLRRWANISPVCLLGYRVLFDATLHVGQRQRQRANINPAFVQSIVGYYSQHKVGLLTTVEWILASTGDACPTFTIGSVSACTALPTSQQTLGIGQHWVNVSCLLGVTGHICVLHIIGCEDIKTLAQLIEPKDDLVTVDHLPGSKSWHSEVSGVVHLAGEDAVDIKNGFHHIKIHSLHLSTVQRSYLVKLITKAIDTTSNSYQPLWLRCWRGDISSFFYIKTRLF